MSKRAWGCVYLICAICLVLPLPAFAQTAEPAAHKFDEFGDIQASDLIARLDNLAIQLQNQPNAKTFLIVYRTRRDLPGLNNRYVHRMKSYLVDSRGILPERVITVDGGITECLTQELWIVLPGSAPPLRPDAHFSSYQPSAYKFDEHHYSSPDDPEDLIYWRQAPADLLSYLESFAQELQKKPKSIGYLIAFRGANRDGAGVSQRMLRTERTFLIREFGIKASRIKTIDGGYQEWRTMELWIAQEHGTVPIVTSYHYLPRRRRR
jgi:hypothetical protein